MIEKIRGMVPKKGKDGWIGSSNLEDLWGILIHGSGPVSTLP